MNAGLLGKAVDVPIYQLPSQSRVLQEKCEENVKMYTRQIYLAMASFGVLMNGIAAGRESDSGPFLCRTTAQGR